MEHAIGKALRDARLKRGLTPEEAAKATRIRADWITDLENEDYHRFPSLGYARNFQILYAKYLGVDLKGGSMIDPGKTVLTTSFDHIYDGVIPVGYRGNHRPKPIRRSRWLLVIIVFSVACIIGAITALFILDVLRLPGWNEMTGNDKEKAPTEERLVVPPTVELEEKAAPSPAPSPRADQEELPPLSEDGTMHPPQPPAPERLYKPSPRLQQLLPSTPLAAPDQSDEDVLNTAFPPEP